MIINWVGTVFKRTCKFNNSKNKKDIKINQYTGLSTW